MAREAVIHIGTMKTGTTAIQFALRKCRPELLAHKAHYSSSLHIHRHKAWPMIAATVRVRKGEAPRLPRVTLGPEADKAIAAFKAEVRAEMESLPADIERVFFSDERLCLTLQHPDEIAELRDLLAPYFERFVIVVYLRPQPAFMASLYSEMLRLRATTKPPTIERPPGALREYDYNTLLDHWSTAFGEAAVKPRLYERGTNKNFSSVADFFNAFGLEALVPDAASHRAVNPSMNLIGQEVLREIGEQLATQGVTGASSKPMWVDIYQTITSALPGAGWQPTRAEAAAFMAQFEASNEAVRQRFFPERASLFADESENYPLERPSGPTDRQLFEAACATFAAGFMRLHKRDGGAAGVPRAKARAGRRLKKK